MLLELRLGRRRVTIRRLELRDFRPGETPQVDLYLECSKGTYVRSIAEDLGRALGCGAHVSVLRRTAAGPFSGKMVVSMRPFAAADAIRAIQGSDALKNLVAEFDRTWGERVRRSRDAVPNIQQIEG